MRSGSGELRGVRALAERIYLRRRLVMGIATALLFPVLCGGGILVYLAERSTQNLGAAIGDPSEPNRIELYVTAQQVNAVQQRVHLRVEVIPPGALPASGLAVPARYRS